jgi:hypothetical protein
MTFRKIFPSKGRIEFDGGLSNEYDKQLIEDNESPDCANVLFDQGSVVTRLGYSKLNTTAVGSFAGDGLFTRRDDTGAETMIAFAGDLMYTLSGTTFTTVPSAQSVFTNGVKVFGDTQEGYMFLCNGNTIPYKYNGAEFTRHGVYPPTTTATAGTNGAGVLTGDYQYKVTAVNSAAVESDVGSASDTFTASSEEVSVTAIPTFPISYGVNARRVYRTEAGGTTFKFLVALNDNSTTSYVDNNADGALGTAAPTDNGLPPNYTAIKYHQSRLFFLDPANPNFLWYTNLGDPYTVASTNFLKIGDNTSDLAKGLGVWQNNIVIFCEKSVFLVYMSSTDDSTWQTIKSQSQYGSNSARCVLEVDNDLLFPAIQNDNLMGFSIVSGISIAQSTTFLTNNAVGSDRQTDRIFPEIKNIQKTGIENISGIVFENRAWLSVQYGTGSTENNRVYVMDFRERRATKNQRFSWVPFTGYSAADWTICNGKLYFISSTANGFVYDAQGDSYDDDGAAIDSYFWTKEFQGLPGDWDFTKDFRYSKILLGKLGDWFMNIKYRTDSDKGDGDTQQVSLDPGGSLWNTMVWGSDTWGGGSDEETIKVFLRGKRGDRIQFRFDNQNAVGQAFKVVNQDFIYNRKGFR